MQQTRFVVVSSACGLRVVLTEPTTLSNLLPPPLLVCACVRLSFALAFCFSVSLQVDPNKPLAPPSANGVRVSSDKYFTPFKLACECRSPKVVRACVRACVLVRGVCVCVCVNQKSTNLAPPSLASLYLFGQLSSRANIAHACAVCRSEQRSTHFRS